MENNNAHKTPVSCLLIDDEQVAIDGLEILIKKISSLYIKGKYTDPYSAIESILELHPEIVFLDIVMAQKTGFEVIDQVRENGINPCFVFVTGYDNYSLSAIKKQVFDYLLKPVDINELKETVNRYLSKRIYKTKTNNFQNFSLQHLSSREKEIVEHLVEGNTSKEISKTLNLSKNTVDTHRRNILKKTGLNTSNELIRYYLYIYR